MKGEREGKIEGRRGGMTRRGRESGGLGGEGEGRGGRIQMKSHMEFSRVYRK